MEITIIHGQRHLGSTYHCSEILKNQISDSETVINEFFMPSDGPAFCVGCFGCIKKGEEHCPHANQIQPIVSAMCRSQVIIIDSPTYCFEMTGQLKTLFDHLGYMWLSHRPRGEMFNKIGIVLSTAAGAGTGAVTKSLARQMSWWGIAKIYRLRFNVNAAAWQDVTSTVRQKIEKRITAVAMKVQRQAGRVEPDLKTRFFFGVMRKMHAKNTWNMTDKNYWLEKQWVADVRPWRSFRG